MQQHRPVRIVKQGQKAVSENVARAAGETSAQPSERELKSVVSGWIHEHRQRSEQYRQAFAEMLKESGFRSPRATSLA